MENANVLLLPTIDLNPTDKTCIYSTLLFIQDQAEGMNLPSACVTFDQPLWLKAMEIITAKGLDNVVCRLGGVHLLMSALGSIGYMMKGSGIEDALGQVYGSNAVSHMMTSKAIGRALRGYLLTEDALMMKLVPDVFPTVSTSEYDGVREAQEQTVETLDAVSEPCVNDNRHNDAHPSTESQTHRQLNADQVAKLSEILANIMEQSATVVDVADSDDLASLDRCLVEQRMTLIKQSRNAKLWFQYLDYITVIKDFIMSERTGNWEWHLSAVGKLLNLVAATGHVNYAKSERLYLQVMHRLPGTHPWLFDKFAEGYHVVRRTNDFGEDCGQIL